MRYQVASSNRAGAAAIALRGDRGLGALIYKAGVSPADLSPVMTQAKGVVDSIYQSFGRQAVITSTGEGEHKAGSLHYEGRAFDVRTNTLGPGEAQSIVAQLKAALGAAYDVVLEATHIHVELDRPSLLELPSLDLPMLPAADDALLYAAAGLGLVSLLLILGD